MYFHWNEINFLKVIENLLEERHATAAEKVTELKLNDRDYNH